MVDGAVIFPFDDEVLRVGVPDGMRIAPGAVAVAVAAVIAAAAAAAAAVAAAG